MLFQPCQSPGLESKEAESAPTSKNSYWLEHWTKRRGKTKCRKAEQFIQIQTAGKWNKLQQMLQHPREAIKKGFSSHSFL